MRRKTAKEYHFFDRVIFRLVVILGTSSDSGHVLGFDD